MDLDAMRRDGCSRARCSSSRVENAERLEWRDQDALNVVLGERRLPLHPRWNCMNAFCVFPARADVFGAEAVGRGAARPGDPPLRGPGDQQAVALRCASASLRELYVEHRRADAVAARAASRADTPRSASRRRRARLSA